MKTRELDYVMNAVDEERYSGTFTPQILIALTDTHIPTGDGCMKLKASEAIEAACEGLYR